MKTFPFKALIQKYWPLYLLTIMITLAMKFFCQITDSDMLTWILTPTTRWAGVLGSISFEYLPHQGYVNHFHRFLIAPSCSGIRFMMITFLMLTFSFLYQIKSTRTGYLWFIFSAVFSYFSTILVNGIRIVLAIYLPVPLEQAGLLNGWLNPDRLHTLIGTAVYFSSLCVIYPTASFICQHGFMRLSAELKEAASDYFRHGFRLLIPAFWYLSAVLALPLLKRMILNDWIGFGTYAVLILGTCMAIIVPVTLFKFFKIASKYY